MEGLDIKKYLEKFKKIIFRKEELSKTISEIISKNLNNIEIPSNIIDIRKTNIYIKKINPILRNEILLQKNNIITEINQNISNYHIEDIK